jgi:two-component system, sensor histidine kinase and response regulator
MIEDVSQAVRVLLVDDQPENLVALEGALASLGYTLIKADSGREALHYLLEQEVAVIVLDVAMPDMDGFETAAMIRARQRCQSTPIIFLTALYADERAQARGYASGGSDYLVKPIDLQVLRAKVKTFAELFVQTQQAQAEALEVRDKFLAIASHELKTPLTAILGYGQLLQRRTRVGGVFTERDQAVLATLIEQVERLDRLASMLLDSAHLHDAGLRIQKAPLDLCALVQRVIGLIEGIADERYSFECVTPEGRMMIAGDELRLEQVFYNLLHNAVKYSLSGGLIEIRVAQHGRQACVSVVDSGIGIPDADQAGIFDQFYRAPNALAENIIGLGLGLSIVREVIALHGGTIDLSSRQGLGSTFTVCLPMED